MTPEAEFAALLKLLPHDLTDAELATIRTAGYAFPGNKQTMLKPSRSATPSA